MALLSFTVRNHKSIRDVVTIDLTRPSLRTLRPRDDDWSAAVFPMAGIFGGNATGKSAVLDAIRYMFFAIRFSSSTWQGATSMPRAPFQLDGTARTSTSLYEIDFVHDGRRHLYGFEVDREGIRSEWLRDVPSSRWRTLLDRDRTSGALTFHSSLKGKVEVTGRELVLSRALLLDASPLHRLAEDLVDGFDCVLVKDSHREARLKDIADSLQEGTVDFGDLESLLQVADIGVTEVGIEETKIPEELLKRVVSRVVREFQHEEMVARDTASDTATEPGTDEADSSPADEHGELDDEEREQVLRHLIFTHRGTTDDSPAFSINDESDGTIAWLAIAVPALEALRTGGLLLVDEIDASLHPHLLELLLGAFADTAVNLHDAQLIFTTHESYVLSPLSDVQLAPEQVWFTDKTYEGATEVTSLADFPKHPDRNVAKRYLTGRYGGTPRLSPSVLASLVSGRAG